MFPPPQPWKQVAEIDPDLEYLAFTSRLALRSVLRVPAFARASFGIKKQVEAAPGSMGYSLGGHLPRLYLYSLSAWQDEDSLRAFSRAVQHGQTLKAFHRDMRGPSPFIRWQVRGRDLPLRWADALERIRQFDEQPRVAPAA
jgi:hypothetical protein